MKSLFYTVVLSCMIFAFAVFLAYPQDTSSKNQLTLEPVFAKLKFRRPLWMSQAPGDTKRLFLAEQKGVIHVFPNLDSVKETASFLDISSKVSRQGNEEGLLALAFHPKYKKNGKFYIWYSVAKPRRTLLSEFQVSKTDPNRADLNSERVLLAVKQPYANHNGGTLLFGPDDGYLYLSIGDGGSGNDPKGHGQNLSTLLATIIRIDVDKKSKGLEYSIPKSNPFVGNIEGAREEIWAYGLRNVWRMSFDSKTKKLWAADVGPNLQEEIDIVEKGGNYGWSLREGKHRNKAGGNKTANGKTIDPIHEYGRSDGVSITGGYVYRGKKMKKLVGTYLYADYATGTIWGLREKNSTVLRNNVLAKTGKNIITFAELKNGDLYILCDDNNGRIYKLTQNK